jgi:hypothetical protein
MNERKTWFGRAGEWGGGVEQGRDREGTGKGQTLNNKEKQGKRRLKDR